MNLKKSLETKKFFNIVRSYKILEESWQDVLARILVSCLGSYLRVATLSGHVRASKFEEERIQKIQRKLFQIQRQRADVSCKFNEEWLQLELYSKIFFLIPGTKEFVNLVRIL